MIYIYTYICSGIVTYTCFFIFYNTMYQSNNNNDFASRDHKLDSVSMLWYAGA